MSNPVADSRSSKVSLRHLSAGQRFSNTTILIFIVLALASAAIVIFLTNGARLKKMIEPEVFNLSYQFLLIVVFGGAVSLLYKQFSDERIRDEGHRTFLRTMHSDLLNVFNAAKLVRRTLRARIGYSPDGRGMEQRMVRAADYQQQMDILNGSQLKFEVYSKQATEHELFFVQGQELKDQFEKIEEYLRTILEEYEINLVEFSGSSPCKPLADLPQLAEFIGPHKKDGRFDANFKIPFSEALSALSRANVT